MQETVSGVRVRGKWDEVVNKGEEVTRILEESDDTKSDHLDGWEDWRPRASEDLEDEHREKTVEKAVTAEGPAEKEGKSASEQAGEAVEDVEEAVGEAVEGDIDSASRKTRRAAFEALLSIDVAARKLLRRFEAFVYHHFASRTSPHYFDSELISASLSKKTGVTGRFRRSDTEDEFEMTVAINDDAVKEEFKEKMKARD